MGTQRSFWSAAFLIAIFCSTASAEAQKPSLEETRKFVESNPALKAWVTKTSKQLEQETLKLVKGLEAVTDGNQFRLPDEAKAGKKLEDKEWQERKRQALQELIAYANTSERQLLALLAGAGIKDFPSLQQRVLKTPAFSFTFLVKDGGQNTATTKIEKSSLKDGKLTVESVGTVFYPLAFRKNSSAHTISHELTHIFCQGWDNEQNADQKPTPENASQLAIYQFKPYRYVRGSDLLAEGFAELTTQRAFEVLGEPPAGVTYINMVGSTGLMCEVDQASLVDWFTGTITTKEFAERFQAKLAALLKQKIDEKLANNDALVVTNQLLDTANPQAGLMGRVTDPATTLSNHMIVLNKSGIDYRAVLRKQLPMHIHSRFRALDKPKEEPTKRDL